MGEAQNFLLEYKVGSFQGKFPAVAIDDRVDIDALTAGDDDPFYATLEIAKVNEVSQNKLQYDQELVAAVHEQMVGKGGIMGHIDIKDRSTAFPIEDVDWVGAEMVGDSLWGKAYVPPGATREYIRRLKARGGKLATSIYGPHESKEFSDNGTYRVRGFRLESVDLAPADRAALQLGGQFAITAQMNDESVSEDDMPTKEQVIAELAVEDIPALPDAIRQQIISEHQASQSENPVVAELRQEVADRDTVISELRNSLSQYQDEAFEHKLDGLVAETINWQVTGEEAQGKVASLQRMLRNRVVAELNGERDEETIKAAFEAAWTEMEPIAEMMRDSLTGPKHRFEKRLGKDTGKIEDTPEARAEARAKWQF